MASILSQAMDRIADMEKEALTTLTSGKVDAVSFYPYQQSALPYFYNWLNGDTLLIEEPVGGEDVVTFQYTVTMRLVIAHLTEGYLGEWQSNAYEFIPAIITFFLQNPFLTSTTFSTELDFIDPNGVIITGTTGLRVFQNTGLNVRQGGVDFTLNLPILEAVY